MIKFSIIILLVIAPLISNNKSGNPFSYIDLSAIYQNQGDTIPDNQPFYNGRLWINNYINIYNDQFLFTRDFLRASVSMRGKTYNNVLIRYDICNDEIITFSETGNLLQLNKEMIDSFSIAYQGKTYRFLNLTEDIKNDKKGFFNVLYEGKTILCLKYTKEIHYSTSEGSDNRFVEKDRLYMFKDGNAYIITKKSDFFKILDVEKSKIRKLNSENKMELSVYEPESFVTLLRTLENSNK